MNKTEKYKVLQKHYEDCYRAHGDSILGVDWKDIDRVKRRMRVMMEPCKGGTTLLDFGCGNGLLLEYIIKNGIDVEYSGLDISNDFVSLCKRKFDKRFSFFQKDILKSPLLKSYDYIVCNGVFTEKRTLTDAEMFDLLISIVEKLFKKTNTCLSFNVMTANVDFKDDMLFYLSYDKITDFVSKNLSINYSIIRNYSAYEYTLRIYKEGARENA